MSQYPNLRRATSMIANDIGTPLTQDEIQSNLTAFLADHSTASIVAIDSWLGSLSEKQFEDVCIGEHCDMVRAVVLAPAGTDTLLDLIAEEIV